MRFRSKYRRPGFAGGPGNTPAPGTGGEYYADKDIFYRTTDIMNGVFKKKVIFVPSDRSMTDGKTIFVNMKKDGPVREVVEKLVNHTRGATYRMSCRHVVKLSKGDLQPGDKEDCPRCGLEDAYLSFEHEWQHIIFKSYLPMMKLFIEEYTAKVKNNILTSNPGIDPVIVEAALAHFPSLIHIICNAHDDIRCNSLWEKVYPGSAFRNWERWQRLAMETDALYAQNGVDSFAHRILCIGVGVQPQSGQKYAHLDPIIHESMRKVRYKGYPNMLTIVRWMLEKCLSTLLNDIKLDPPVLAPPPQSGMQAQQQQPQPGASDADGGDDDRDDDPQPDDQDDPGVGDPDPGADPGDAGDAGDDDQGQDVDVSAPLGAQDPGQQAGLPSACPPPPPQNLPPIPSLGNTMGGKGQQLAKIIQQMTQGVPSDQSSIDPNEKHKLPDGDPKDDEASRAIQHAVAKALGQDVDDDQDLDAGLGVGDPDPDMQQAIQQLVDGMNQATRDHYLLSGAKASVTFVDVPAYLVRPSSRVTLTAEEQAAVQRIRASFFKAEGRRKMERAAAGGEIDIESAIQHLVKPEDGMVFENEGLYRGFCYHILTDMSGSMSGTRFNQVCHGVEMLKAALKFPFVFGSLWGFRGGGGGGSSGSVWIYRYEKDCHGYQGEGLIKKAIGGPMKVPVECGGLTPMHSAILVSTKHLLTQPSGAVKRLFILTDGSPIHTKVGGGGQISPAFLMKMVAKEISKARQKGIGVYTIIIGDDISEDQAVMMFGNRKYWKRVSAQNTNFDTVDKALTRVVMENFQKYMQARS